MTSTPAPKMIGGEYQSYAPGHGAVVFVHVCNGKATNERVPLSACKRLTPPGWILWELCWRYEAYRPVQRVSLTALECEGRVYSYYLPPDEGSYGYRFMVLWNGQEQPLRNESMAASLNYFLTYEDDLSDPPPASAANEA